MRIELVLTNPLLVDHFGPIARALARRGHDAAFVCVPVAKGPVLGAERKHALHASCMAAVTKAELPLRTRCDPTADVAITALGGNELHLYQRCKLKLRYGVSLHRAAIHHNRAMSAGFDGLLVHGMFEYDLFSRWIAAERIKIMGIPRHDAHFQHPPSREAVRARLAIRAASVLSYFPTWSVQSSLRSHLPELLALSRRHLLLVKPHALSRLAAEERGALDALSGAGAKLLGDEVSFVDTLAAGDLTLTDATSGATPEALLLAAGKPLVLLSTRNIDELFAEIELAGPLVRPGGDLQRTVAAMLVDDPFRDRRSQLRVRLFADYAGHAAERAVDCIATLAQLPKISAAPSLIERAFPRPFRVARGQRVALGCRLAVPPPRTIVRARPPSP